MSQKLRNSWWLIFVGLAVGLAFTQQASPPPNSAPPAHVVRISRGSTSGMSGGGEKLVIEPAFIRWDRDPSSDWQSRGIPAEKRTCKITRREWETLRNSIDAKMLAAFTGIKTCRPCIDLPETWAAIEFSDGTKKAVDYDFSHPPPEIAALLREIEPIAAKCPSLTVFSPGNTPISTVRNAAKPIETVQPVYPEAAKTAGVQGSVAVYVIVGGAGEVQTVTAADGPEELRQAAIEAVGQWKWAPYRMNGKPIRFRTRVVVNFAKDGQAVDTKEK